MYIITGGAGFIGSVTATALELGPSQASNIVLVDSFGNSSKWQNVVKRNVRDIIHPNKLMHFIEHHKQEIQAIIHFGATSSTTEKNVDSLLENNVCYSTALFDWCAENNIRFIFASSASVYGDGSQGFEDTEDLQYLNKLRPQHPQGWSKLLVEKYMLQAPKKPPSWVSLRFFNVYGPNEYHKGRKGSVVHHSFNQAQSDGTVRLYKSYMKDCKNGEQQRDFIYVKDIARLVLWLVKHPNVSGIYNIGSGQSRTFNDLTNILLKTMKKKINVEFIDMPPESKSNYQYFTEAKIDKIFNAITNSNTNPFKFTSLEDGIGDYVQNYLLKQDPYL